MSQGPNTESCVYGEHIHHIQTQRRPPNNSENALRRGEENTGSIERPGFTT